MYIYIHVESMFINVPIERGCFPIVSLRKIPSFKLWETIGNYRKLWATMGNYTYIYIYIYVYTSSFP